MRRFVVTFLLALVIVGGVWVLVHRDQIKNPTDAIALLKQQLASISPAVRGKVTTDEIRSDQNSNSPIIRIASYKLQPASFGPMGLDAQNLLANICRQYDLIALQGPGIPDPTGLQEFVDGLNNTSDRANYTWVMDTAKSSADSSRSAILYNQTTLELEQGHWYSVNDPDDLLKHDPLVGWFRVRMPNRQEAFTFTLANVEMSAGRPDLELAYIGELFRAIRRDGRGEDDIILVGDFNAGDRGLAPLRDPADLAWVVSNTPTDLKKQIQYDNLIFSKSATSEYVGKGGVFDPIRHFNLRSEDAAALSDRMPVWAEFSVFEGGDRHVVRKR